MFHPNDILFEDNHLIVVNKRCGDLVQPDPNGDSALENEIKAFIKVRDNNLMLLNNLNTRLESSYKFKYEKSLSNFNRYNSLLKSNLINQIIDKNENKLNQLIDKCILLNPFNVMLKGYAMVKRDDKIVKSINDIKENDNLDIVMHDGILNVDVKNIRSK